MNIKEQIRDLWSYLKIQDKETLIIQAYNNQTKIDEFIIAKMAFGKINISTSKELPIFMPGDEFQIISHLDSHGKHRIPSVKQLMHEEDMDY